MMPMHTNATLIVLVTFDISIILDLIFLGQEIMVPITEKRRFS